MTKIGYKQTEEHKRNIGNALREKKRAPFSDEWIQNMSKSHKGKSGYWNGKHFSEKHRKNISKSAENNSNFGMRNKHQTNYQKKKVSETITGKHLSEEHKRKIVETRRKNNSYVVSEDTKQKISRGLKNNLPSTIFKIGEERVKEIRAKTIFPKVDTKIELKIQNFLKQLEIEFFTHQYIKDIEHRYQCDILIPSMNMVIEADGTYWHKYPIGNEIDHIRTKELLEKGFKVLRLWEFEINDMTIDTFKNKLNNK